MQFITMRADPIDSGNMVSLISRNDRKTVEDLTVSVSLGAVRLSVPHLHLEMEDRKLAELRDAPMDVLRVSCRNCCRFSL